MRAEGWRTRKVEASSENLHEHTSTMNAMPLCHCMLIKDGNGDKQNRLKHFSHMILTDIWFTIECDHMHLQVLFRWSIYTSSKSFCVLTIDMPCVTYSSSLHYWQPLHMAGCQCGQSSGDIFTLTWIESLWERWVDCTCFLWSLYPHCSFTLLCLVFHNLWLRSWLYEWSVVTWHCRCTVWRLPGEDRL